ncbi:MAG: aromatic amino acid lyase [Kineosporiaceae bacterium]
MTSGEPRVLIELLGLAEFGVPVRPLSTDETARMEKSVAVLDEVLRADGAVYGVTSGFGALVDHPGDGPGADQGDGLIRHLGTAQGAPLDPAACRLAVWLRLTSMRRGWSAVSPAHWSALSELYDRGFVPALPRAGTVSASGDLQPLASAALSLAGVGQAWHRGPDGRWVVIDAEEGLRRVGAEPLHWPAREALAFVNGTSVGLAVTMLNHHELQRLLRASALLTARLAELLGAGSEPFHPGLSEARGHPGQAQVAEWIREDLPSGHPHRGPGRPLQEPYSLRGAPQVLGAVLDQLQACEPVLVREALGCTDNPVFHEGQVLHGANFHALPVGLVSDQLGLLVQQVAFLMERQLAIVCSPDRNGGLPPMLACVPGRDSGLAGVQISATSFVSAIRQRVAPATLTALPTNGTNQDHVPMSLVGAVAVNEALDAARWVLGSLAVATAQLAALTGGAVADGVWRRLGEVSPPLERDRPMAAEVRGSGDLLMDEATSRLARRALG